MPVHKSCTSLGSLDHEQNQWHQSCHARVGPGSITLAYFIWEEIGGSEKKSMLARPYHARRQELAQTKGTLGILWHFMHLFGSRGHFALQPPSLEVLGPWKNKSLSL